MTGLGPLRTRLQRSAGRGLTKFVGREREMEALKHAAEQARPGTADRRGDGGAGLGKSRLFFEFKADIQSGWMVLETFSVSHGKASAYLPVIDLLRSYFRIAGEDDQRTRREKVDRHESSILDRSLEDTLPYLFALARYRRGRRSAGADGRADQEAAHARGDQANPVARDPQSAADGDLRGPALDRRGDPGVSKSAGRLDRHRKILLLVNYRPEYSHQWNSKTYYTQLRLDPLGKESAEEMLSALLGDPPNSPLKR